MTIESRGLAAIDVGILPDLLIPSDHVVSDASDWIAQRSRLTRKLRTHEYKFILANLDGRLIDAMWDRCEQRAGSLEADDLQMLHDLLTEVQTSSYRRSTTSFDESLDYARRELAISAMESADSMMGFDQIGDCPVAARGSGVVFNTVTAADLDACIDAISDGPETRSILQENEKIVDALMPLAVRFEDVALSGRFLGPDHGYEMKAATELLRRLVEEPSSRIRRFELHFETWEDKGRKRPPSVGCDLERKIDGILISDSMPKLDRRQIRIDVFCWPRKRFPVSNDRHLVVGNEGKSFRGITITHFGDDNRGLPDGQSKRTTLSVMKGDMLTDWHSEFRVRVNDSDYWGGGDPPERRIRINGRWLADDEERPT
ncbi:hypothetical protein OAF82_01010 [bacterium]|nr:hypothetical protein [bacterium]